MHHGCVYYAVFVYGVPHIHIYIYKKCASSSKVRLRSYTDKYIHTYTHIHTYTTHTNTYILTFIQEEDARKHKRKRNSSVVKSEDDTCAQEGKKPRPESVWALRLSQRRKEWYYFNKATRETVCMY